MSQNDRSKNWRSLGRAMLTVLAMAVATTRVEGATSVRISGHNLDRVIEQQVAHGFSGVVLIARGGQPIVFRGAGSLAGVKIRRESPFWIASGAKQFTSAAILSLVEARRLRLDDRLDRFFPDAPPDKAAITIRQLLAHTSGLAQSYSFEGARGRSEAVAAMFSEPVKAPPGGTFSYSNANYALAAAIIEVASGQEYDRYVRRLWGRAGLVATGFSGTPEAALVSPVTGELPLRLRVKAWGGHNVFSSATDLFRWYRALQTRRVLRPSSVRALFAPAAQITEGQTGLGWFLGRTVAGNPFIFTRGNDDLI